MDHAEGKVDEDVSTRFQLSDTQRRTFTESFLLFDKSKTGLLPLSDFPALFRSIGQNPSETDLRRIEVSLQSNGTDTFDLAAFLAICESGELKELMRPDVLLETFRQLDKDGNQTFSMNQLRAILQVHGEKLPVELAESFLAYAVSTCDQEKTGLINYETLVRFLLAKDPGVTWTTE